MKTLSVSSRFQPAVDHLTDALRGVRTGRASTGLVEALTVEHYGTMMRLKDIASLSTPDARTISIEPWDTSAVQAIEKAITTSSLGLNPAVQGSVLRISVPPLTEERRKELVKLVGKYVEDARITVRNIREKTLRDLKRQQEEGDLSEDAFNRERDKLQKEVDDAVAVLEQHGKQKEEELIGT